MSAKRIHSGTVKGIKLFKNLLSKVPPTPFQKWEWTEKWTDYLLDLHKLSVLIPGISINSSLKQILE